MATYSAPPVLADRDVVRLPGQRNLLRDLQRLRIDDVERRGRLVAEVQPAAVRCGGHAMDHFGVRNLAHDLVGGWIDQVNAVAGGIGLDDDGACGLRRQRKRDDGQQKQETEAAEHSHGDEPPAAHSNTTALKPGTTLRVGD